jgi:hypothetical protein
MTGEFHPGWVNGINATEARLATGLLTAPDGATTATPLGTLAGIRPTPGFPGQVTVVAGSNPVAVSVNPFQAVIPDKTAGGGGAFLATLGSVQQLPLAAADGSQFRTDLVVAEIDPSSTNGFVVHVVTGKPGNPPQPPAVANPSYLVLAQISVPPTGGGTPVVADKRTLTTALGGILPVFTPDQRPAKPYQGMYVHRLDTNNLEMFDGAVWRSLVINDTGWFPLTLKPGWVSFAEEQFGKPRVRRVGDIVYLRGIVAPTADVPAQNTQPVVISEMPSNFAIPNARIWIAAAQVMWTQLAIAATSLQVQFKNPWTINSGTWVSLETSWLAT